MWKAMIEQITALRPVLETLASYSNVSWRCDFWLYVFIGKSPSIDMVVPGEKKKLWPVYSILLGEGITSDNKSFFFPSGKLQLQ